MYCNLFGSESDSIKGTTLVAEKKREKSHLV